MKEESLLLLSDLQKLINQVVLIDYTIIILGYDYLIPIFTMGKYYKEDNKIILPLAIQVHHAVCDGFHICRFVNELQELINS